MASVLMNVTCLLFVRKGGGLWAYLASTSLLMTALSCLSPLINMSLLLLMLARLSSWFPLMITFLMLLIRVLACLLLAKALTGLAQKLLVSILN